MIYLGSDHAGFYLKEDIKAYLASKSMQTKDLGPFELQQDDDYPDFILPLAQKVSQDPGSRGIALGASGQGEAIAANKVKGILAAVYYGGPLDIVKLSRAHNNSNILSLGARFLTSKEAILAVQTWLDTSFEGGRHEQRIEKIKQAER
ncbi:MAG: RpiB/LacA/LacB family sugar-phosphate isomerase [Candidatus Wildermuthbacteria bacterium]|nr:RpiB/LacA/LacB family sugar-phosphate isomerase [Candidatus Wildermuthbacteria bacterium]